jgi:hypothetical protein
MPLSNNHWVTPHHPLARAISGRTASDTVAELLEFVFDETVQSAVKIIFGNWDRGHDLLGWPAFEWAC